MGTSESRPRDVIDPFEPAVQEAASVIVAAIIRNEPAELALVGRQSAEAAMSWAFPDNTTNRIGKPNAA